jgi:hypothetical protein
MKSFTVLASAVALATSALASPSVAQRATELEAVTVKGNAFFKGNERFYVRGIDYQPGGSSKLVDPLADVDLCKRDIAKFKELGTNVVRVYSVDNSQNHDECMALLAEAGIYLVLDASTPDYSINRADPKPSYNSVYLQHLFATIDVFAKYTNTLAFFSGNEVINDGTTTACAPYVKAVTRDMRRYIRERGYRQIPVGYSAADVSESRMEMAYYMNCGSDEERSDFCKSTCCLFTLGYQLTIVLSRLQRLLLVRAFLLPRVRLGPEGQELHRLRSPHLPLRVRLQQARPTHIRGG